MQTEYQIQCPYCGEQIWMEFYPQDGADQETIIDCEVCCSPIQYHIRFDQWGNGTLSVDRS